MIDEILVHNLALIKSGSIQPSEGLTAITGETGAGKTALLSSCRLLIGARADKGLVREGEAEACVQGRFFIDPNVYDSDKGVCAMSGSENDVHQPAFSNFADEEVVVSRRLSTDGRSRVQINGEMASVGEVSSRISPLIDLCSQHDQQRLLKPSVQRDLLDMWIGDECKRALISYREALEKSQAAKKRLVDIRESRTTSNAAVEEARFVLGRIDEIEPALGEYEDLIQTLEKSENAEMLANSTDLTHNLLSGEDGVLDKLNAIISALDDAAKYDDALKAVADSVREANFILEDASREAVDYRDGIEFDPETLAANQERVAAYQGIMRAYGPTVKDVLAAADAARHTIDLVDNSDELERCALEEFERAESELLCKADALSEIRKLHAPEFGREVSAVMSSLEMGSADLVCAVERQSRNVWTASGPDRMEFLFRPSSGMQPRPLSRIASGGELSRVMLAIHVVMGEHDNVSTLIFDEIDAGVGGATALALADVLARLARTHQVIVVTHLAQIAARASKQYVVHKHDVDGIAETAIDEVTSSDRVLEIARMLSGSTTDASLAHARELLSA